MFQSTIPSLLLLAAFSLAARGDTPVAPTIPAPGLHPLVMDKTAPTAFNARAFFDARKADTVCQGELATMRASYLSARESLAKMAGSSDLDLLDDQGTIMEQARDEWVAKMRECGKCWSQDIELRAVPTAGRTEYWYIGDGSCQLDTLETKILADSFKAKTESLTTADAYRHYTGGFPTVLDFFLVNPTTGAKMNDQTPNPLSPFYAFIAVKGPSIFGVPSAFGYYYKNQIVNRQTNGVTEYIHTFEAERAPRGFQAPSNIAIVLPSGRKRSAKSITVTRVQGMWYLTGEGYLRYYTAADLGMNLDFAKKIAQATMLTTLATLYERGVGEAP